MPDDRIVLINLTIDQRDLLGDFLDWYFHLGIDLALVHDLGSTDRSRELLDDFAQRRAVVWSPLPERDMTKHDPASSLAELARDKYQADWIIFCDADEFLCPLGADLRTILRDAENTGMTMLSVPCFNMTGPVMQSGQRATEALTLRIDRTVNETAEQQLSGELPVPFIFIQHPPHTIVRASAFRRYGPGAHSVEGSWGKSGDVRRLRFLHYPMRGYNMFEAKVRNTAAWLSDNKHLEPRWGWHWRRWIRLREAGQLREDYENQFVTPARAHELVRNGTCTLDETVADWVKRRRPVSDQTWRQRILARLFG